MAGTVISGPAPTWNGSAYQSAAVEEYGPAETYQVGGSRFALYDGGAINPVGYGPVIQDAPWSVQSVPPSYGTVGTGNTGSTLGQSPAGAAIATNAANAPFSPTQSPLVWVVVGLVGVLFYMDRVHWKGGKD